MTNIRYACAQNRESCPQHHDHEDGDWWGWWKDDEDEEEDMNLNWEVMSTVHQAGLQNRESCPHYLCSSPPRHAHCTCTGAQEYGQIPQCHAADVNLKILWTQDISFWFSAIRSVHFHWQWFTMCCGVLIVENVEVIGTDSEFCSNNMLTLWERKVAQRVETCAPDLRD